MLLDLALVFLIAYLIGSIPFGLILTRMAGLGDIRAIGSGNIGATNVMRTGKKWLGILVFFLDAFKGIFVVWITAIYLYEAYYFGECENRFLSKNAPFYSNNQLFFIFSLHLAAFTVVLGHVFSAWLKFRGGKGVATCFGVSAVLIFVPFNLWIAPSLMFLLWGVVFLISRISSLSSLLAVWSMPLSVLIILYYQEIRAAEIVIPIMPAILALPLLITYTHRENIRRIISGAEHKFGKKKV